MVRLCNTLSRWWVSALGGNRVWSCCLCGAVGIRALDQVPKQALNSFHMSPTTDPMGQIPLSPFSHFICVYCSLRSSQTDTPHCNLAARTQTYLRTPWYRIPIKHSLITHRGVCKYRIIQNCSGEDKSHTLPFPFWNLTQMMTQVQDHVNIRHCTLHQLKH